MKPKASLWFIATIFLLGVANPVPTAAQEQTKLHHHYKLIDVSTFGGPSSYLNAFVDGFAPRANGPFFGGARVLTGKGLLTGWADTSQSDPFPTFCFNPDCFVSHAFEWHDGILSDLGTLADGWSSATTWINESGEIVGLSENGLIDPLIGLPEVRAVRWSHGRIIDLGTLGGNQSAALAVNNHGQIAGLALNAIPDPFSIYDLLNYSSPSGTQTRAVLWDEDGRIEDLGTLGGPDAYALLMNEHGQVTGWSYTNSTPNAITTLPTFHPFLWEKGKGMQDLGTLGGTATQAVNGLNERGEVVGATTLAGDLTHHAFLWDGKKLIDLGTLGGDNSEADWVNNAGEIVGIAQYTVSCPNRPGLGGAHGFLWKNGVMTDLGSENGVANSEAVFINSSRQIVGYSFSCDFSVVDALLWERGSVVNLNALISQASPFHLFFSAFVNDQGEIGAFGSLPNGDTHAVLLIPCDDKHPDIDGCDYDLVEGGGTATVTKFKGLWGP
jgi:probable HAF family extracellular repeat protein